MSNRDLLKRFADGTPVTPAEINHLIECYLLTKTANGGTVLTSAGILLLNSDLPPGTAVEVGPQSLYYKNRDRIKAPPGDSASCPDEDLLNQQARARLDAVTAVPSLLTGESDPLGKHQHETGAKLDAGKPRLGLVLGAFANALAEVGKVGTYGAQKYTDNGWLDVPKGKARYTDALLRHILAETNESHDPDTHLHHAAHAAWNALARLELILRKRGDE